VSPLDDTSESDTPEIVMEDDSVPDNAACATCQYSELTAANAQLQRSRICRRFPPVVVTVPNLNRQGQLIGFAFNVMQPIVADAHWCYEYDERENGGAEIEPTGLLIPGN